MDNSTRNHRNTITTGPAHYFKSVNGGNLVFRENEIKETLPTREGLMVQLHTPGVEYRVTSLTPYKIEQDRPEKG